MLHTSEREAKSQRPETCRGAVTSRAEDNQAFTLGQVLPFWLKSMHSCVIVDHPHSTDVDTEAKVARPVLKTGLLTESANHLVAWSHRWELLGGSRG